MNTYTIAEVDPNVPDSPMGWTDVASGINSGSWAIVLFLFVSFMYLKKPFERYIEKQTEVLDKLKETLGQNADTLKTMADTDAEMTRALADMQKVNSAQVEHLGDIAQRNTEDHTRMLSLLTDIILELKGKTKE